MGINCINNSELCETMMYINESQQEFWMKLIILTLLLFMSLYMWYKSKDLDPGESNYMFLRTMTQKYFVFVYVLFSPLMFLYLRLDFEMFTMFLFTIYGIGFALGLGLVALWGKDKIKYFLSKEAYDNRQLKKKYGKN